MCPAKDAPGWVAVHSHLCRFLAPTSGKAKVITKYNQRPGKQHWFRCWVSKENGNNRATGIIHINRETWRVRTDIRARRLWRRDKVAFPLGLSLFFNLRTTLPSTDGLEEELVSIWRGLVHKRLSRWLQFTGHCDKLIRPLHTTQARLYAFIHSFTSLLLPTTCLLSVANAVLLQARAYPPESL